MKYLLLLLLFISSSSISYSQQITADSVFRKLESKFSPKELLKIITEYNEADDMKKAIMLNVLSMPMSSKKELIANYDRNSKNIADLIDLYRRMAPRDYIISMELKSSSTAPGMVESIDFQVYKKSLIGEPEFIDGDWDMRYGSAELDSLLSIVGWDRTNLLVVKNLLQTARCISIQNNQDHYEIGFERSGLGKYFYMVFPKKPSKKQLEQYSDACHYFYYKDNVILKYIGGMAGPQCFTD